MTKNVFFDIQSQRFGCWRELNRSANICADFKLLFEFLTIYCWNIFKTRGREKSQKWRRLEGKLLLSSKEVNVSNHIKKSPTRYCWEPDGIVFGKRISRKWPFYLFRKIFWIAGIRTPVTFHVNIVDLSLSRLLFRYPNMKI